MTVPDETSPRRPGDPYWRSRIAHRSCDPEIAALLRYYRQARGWNVSEAARRSGVSRRMIGLLEHAQRLPSCSTIDALVDAYGMTGEPAERARAIGIPDVGCDSPYKTGRAPWNPHGPASQFATWG